MPLRVICAPWFKSLFHGLKYRLYHLSASANPFVEGLLELQTRIYNPPSQRDSQNFC